MSQPKSAPLVIRPATIAERADLLRSLIHGLEGAPLDAALDSLANQPGSILLAGYRGSQIAGAIWLQPQEGGTTFLVGPQIADQEPESTRLELLRRAVELFEASPSTIAQALIATDAGPQDLALRAAGFEEATVLLYLVSLKESFPSAEPRRDFELAEISETDFPRLAAVLERTYIGTLDCAAVHEERSALKSIPGYLATGESGHRHWRFVREGDRDIGCVLLGDFPKFDQLELVYVGITPEVRGRGLGRDLIRYAQWMANALGRERLVCAVDEANAPAVAMYAACDFQVWQRRHVWLRKKAPSTF